MSKSEYTWPHVRTKKSWLGNDCPTYSSEGSFYQTDSGLVMSSIVNLTIFSNITKVDTVKLRSVKTVTTLKPSPAEIVSPFQMNQPNKTPVAITVQLSTTSRKTPQNRQMENMMRQTTYAAQRISHASRPKNQPLVPLVHVTWRVWSPVGILSSPVCQPDLIVPRGTGSLEPHTQARKARQVGWPGPPEQGRKLRNLHLRPKQTKTVQSTTSNHADILGRHHLNPKAKRLILTWIDEHDATEELTNMLMHIWHQEINLRRKISVKIGLSG